MSEQTYYNNDSQWGDYSYVTLEQIINDFLAVRSSDDYTFFEDRTKVIYHAKRGLRELYYDVLQEVRAIELDVSSTLQVVLPPDFVSYVRISWVDDNGNLFPMSVNNSLSISRVYLQDNNYEILFDQNGNILESPTPTDPTNTTDNLSKYRFCNTGFSPNLDRSTVFQNGSYRIDKNNGVIRFSSDVFDRSVVLEYISDGLYVDTNGGDTEDQIRIHKFAEEALINYIYYCLIKTRRNVPFNEKRRAEKSYFNSRRLAKRRLNAANRDEIIQSFKSSDVWIKGQQDQKFNYRNTSS